MLSNLARTHRLRLSLAATGVVALGLAACVFGYRGQVDFGDEVSLVDIDTVQLVLPPTELVLSGEASRTFADWQGTWVTLGGSSNDALDGARRAALVWETWERVGRLSAELPLDIQNITALDHLDVQSASYLAHEIVGAGDVYVSGIEAYISVTLDGGDVQVLGGTEQVHVSTARGDVEIKTAASVAVESGLGRVTVSADAGRDIEITTYGQVRVELADASSLDIDIADAGQIVVDLDSATHVGRGSYRRAVGSASNVLRVRSGGALVELAMLPMAMDPDPGTETGTGTGG